MRRLTLGYCGFLFATVQLLAGCSALQPPFDSAGTLGATPQSAAAGRPWMLSKAKNEDLLYVTGDDTFVYSYPSGELVGSLGVAGIGLCSDKNGNVFVTTFTTNTYEYAHGGLNPINTLTVGGAQYAWACAADPSTGDVAVAFGCGPYGCGAYGDLAIFLNGSGGPNRYKSPLGISACGYDDKGNLFLTGYAQSTGWGLEELSKYDDFTTSSLNEAISDLGQIQWEGKDFAVEGWANNPVRSPEIYRVRISGNGGSAKVIGSTNLDGAGHQAGLSWIQGKYVAAPSQDPENILAGVGIWKYPAGGKEIRRLGGGTQTAYGLSAVTVSVAPSALRTRR